MSQTARDYSEKRDLIPHAGSSQTKKAALMANADQLGEPRRYAYLVAAAEGCVRLRSSRKSGSHDLSEVPRTLILRLLRSRTQPSAAATDCVVA